MVSELELVKVMDDQTACVRPLFAALAEWNVSIGAVLDGTCPGRAWTDDLDAPRSAFLITPEGSFLAGEPDNPAFHAALRRFFAETVFNPEGFGFFALVMAFDPAWEPYWDAIFPRPAVRYARQHYVCTQVTHDWRAAVPEGFSVRPIDAALLDAPEVSVPDHVWEWIDNNWCKRANYLTHGFGIAVVHDAADRPAGDPAPVVCWSLADGISGTYAEIGIQTEPDYRQRGLAAITAAANVEQALARGYASVGWHCHTDNTGSWRTALRVGFTHERDYTHLVCYARDAEDWQP